MNTTLLLMSVGIGSRFGTGIKQLGGKGVSAVKIEIHLNSFYKVKDSAVIGIYHSRYGEAVEAIVELKK